MEKKQYRNKDNTVLYIVLGLVGVFLLYQLAKPRQPNNMNNPYLQIDPRTGQRMSTTSEDYQGLGSMFAGISSIISSIGGAFSNIYGSIGGGGGTGAGSGSGTGNPYGVAPGTMAGGENFG